ncbi:MAG TPA: GNAT family N-acetyltransferase [Chthonomonadaceae bacterium]|nr:GNAT family N-acetyltransferase [Chthonomonadaceae bacterium]
MTVRRIRTGEADIYRSIRLRALSEAPEAFCSTYENAIRRSPESWVEQADEAAEGTDRAIFLALDGAEPVGMAALYRDPDAPASGNLLQMWVAPDRRGTGLAADLLDAVFAWAAANGFEAVRAAVMRTNDRALRFYEKYGLAGGESGLACDTVTLIKAVGRNG